MRFESESYPVNVLSYDTDFSGLCLEGPVRQETIETGLLPGEKLTEPGGRVRREITSFAGIAYS